MCQIWVGHKVVQYEIWNTWFLDEQDTGQDTGLKKSVVQSILLCLSYLFMYNLTSKFIKNWKKKSKKKKKEMKSLNFAESNAHQKNKCMWPLWDMEFIYFFLAL